ncbi:hypothetical protein DFP73DRAFT_596278 [Morchella snyderi]|nr:hypothetical protein DFP73DRAFT_596278 [Morchella snyderi]
MTNLDQLHKTSSSSKAKPPIFQSSTNSSRNSESNSTDDEYLIPNLPRHPYQRVLNIICGYSPVRLLEPHRRYDEFVIIGRETWRPSATLLTENVPRRSWDSFLTNRLLRSTTTWTQWEKDFHRIYFMFPQMIGCFLSHGWDDATKLPHHLSPSARSFRTIKSILQSWYPSLDNEVTIIFQYAAPPPTKVSPCCELQPLFTQQSTNQTRIPKTYSEDHYTIQGGRPIVIPDSCPDDDDITENEAEIESIAAQQISGLPGNYTPNDTDMTPESETAASSSGQTTVKNELSELKGYEGGILPDNKRRRIHSTEL